MKETEKAVLQFFRHRGIDAKPLPPGEDPPDFEIVADNIGIESASISSQGFLIRSFEKAISSVETSKGHWIRAEVWEQEEFYCGTVVEAHTNSRQNRIGRQNYFTSKIKSFLKNGVRTGNHTGEDREWENHGIKVRVDVLDRKDGRHSLGQYDTMNFLGFLLPRMLEPVHEKSKKIAAKRDSYAKWWLVLTINDGIGCDLPIRYRPFGNLWFGLLRLALGWGGNRLQKFGFEKIILLDVKDGGFIQWHFDEHKMPLSVELNFDIAGWSPWESDFISECSGRDMFSKGGPQWFFPPDEWPRMDELLASSHEYFSFPISHHSGVALGSRVSKELFAFLDRINSQEDLPSVKNSLTRRAPIISPPFDHPLKLLKLKREVFSTLPREEQTLLRFDVIGRIIFFRGNRGGYSVAIDPSRDNVNWSEITIGHVSF